MAKRIVADDAKFSAVPVGKEKAVFPVAPDEKPGDALSASLHKKKYRDKDVEDEALDDQLPVIADAEQVAPDSAFTAAEQPMLLAQADVALAPASDSAATGQTNASNSGSNAGWWWLGAGVVATGAGIGVGVSGGGGGGNSGSSTTTITGTVTDGPVQGARLYIDVNGNGTYDVGTDTAVLDANGNQVVTDASGNFSFTVTGSGAGIKLVTNGGIDTVTGEAVTLDFSAPAGYSQINPITSAIAAYMEANPGITAAQAEVAVESALGLPDLDYSTVNLANPPAGLAAADILAAQQAVAILATAAIIVEQSGTDADAFRYLAENLGVSGSTSALVTAVQSADPTSAAQLAETVAAIEAATDLAAVDNALNDTFHNDPPAFTSATTASVAENSTAVMTVAATDPDPNGQTVTYSITGGADQAEFTINSTTGALVFIGAPDFENPTDSDGNNSYEVQVTADDGNGGSTSQTVTATVTNINEAPVITSASTGTVVENAATSTVVYTAVATDVDAGDTRTYSLSGTDAALFNIDAASGAVTLKNSADYEADTSYAINVIATDAGGLTATQAVTVNVTNVNEAPVITSASTGTVAENAASSTVVYTVAATDADADDTRTYSLSGTDAALFNIDAASGAVTLKNSADYEADTSYAINVIATDAGLLTATQAVTVNVTNVNEAPVITSNAGGATAAASAAENQTAVTTVTSTDVDAGDGKTFSLSGGADQALFAINGATGALTFLSAPNYESPADADSNNVYDVQVTVTDTAGLTDVQDLAVTVTDANEAPVITSNGGGATAALNIAENQTAVTTVTSSDMDAGDGKTLSLTGGADQALFAINGTTGALTFLSAPNYESPADADSNNVYDVQVTVTDTVGLTDVQDLAVTVTNVDENVVVDSTGTWIDLNANGVKDAEDTTEADFTAGMGNIDLITNPITIHFNDVPDIPLDLTGFTSDDKIEIDVPAFNEVRMRTSPANSFTGLSTNTNAVYLGLGNQDYYSVFLAPRTLPSFTENKGAFAFYTSTINYLAYWNDLSNPLGNMSNILPTLVTTSGSLTPLAVLNMGAGYGELIDFIWTPATSFPATAVVVESTGAWIDTNADGVHDVGETTPWVGGRDNVAGHQVTIHFNSVPSQPLDLAGFGSDDLIEIDAQAFINNGHNALNILTRPNILKTDDFNTLSSLPSTSNWLSSRGYAFANWYTTSNGWTTAARVGLFYSSSSSLYFTSNNGLRFTGYQFATGISTNLPLQQMVNFVNFPVPPETVHVVVERNGAVIDYDGDGVRDSGENRLAVFSAGGNADLTGVTPVIIHFNDVPFNALNLTGFGTDDKIELDVAALTGNGIINSEAAMGHLASVTIGAASRLGFNFTRIIATTSGFTTVFNGIRAYHTNAGIRADFGGSNYASVFGLSFANIDSAISSRFGGIAAYWTETSNPLNSTANLRPDYINGASSNYEEVLVNLNANHYAGLVEFVWPVNVVVENDGAWIDANANGVHDIDETASAVFAPGGNADLAADDVTIHFNDLPGVQIDLSGFDGNDRIQIDVAAMRNDSDTPELNNQGIQTISSSQTQVYGGFSGVSNGGTAIYISGGNLKFGHRTTTTSIIGSFTVINTNYIAAGSLEGGLASNAGALANHFQQVVFVTPPL